MVFGRFLGYIRFLLSYRRKIYILRKRYDRVRERADKLRNREKKLSVLKILDQVEPTLVMLEEQNISRWERRRMFRYVKSGTLEAKQVLKEKYKVPYPTRIQVRRRR